MLVRDYMTINPVAVSVDDPLSRLGQVFDVERFRHLPVTDASGALVGIVSDRDLRNIKAAMEILESSLSGEGHVRVRDVMTQGVRSVEPGMPLSAAAQLLLTERIGALPVVEAGRLVGMLSYTDVLRAFIEVAPGG